MDLGKYTHFVLGEAAVDKVRDYLASMDGSTWDQWKNVGIKAHSSTPTVAVRYPKDWHVVSYEESKELMEMIDAAVKVVEEAKGYECVVTSAVFAKVSKGESFEPEMDSNEYSKSVHRVHWVIQSDPGKMTYRINNERVTMKPTELVEVNCCMKSKVTYQGDLERIHLIMDLMKKDVADSKGVTFDVPRETVEEPMEKESMVIHGPEAKEKSSNYLSEAWRNRILAAVDKS